MLSGFKVVWELEEKSCFVLLIRGVGLLDGVVVVVDVGSRVY